MVASSKLTKLCLCRSLHTSSFSLFVDSFCFCLFHFWYSLSPTSIFPYRQPAVGGGVLEAFGTLPLKIFLPFLFLPLRWLLLLLFILLLNYAVSYTYLPLLSVGWYWWRPRIFWNVGSTGCRYLHNYYSSAWLLHHFLLLLSLCSVLSCLLFIYFPFKSFRFPSLILHRSSDHVLLFGVRFFPRAFGTVSPVSYTYYLLQYVLYVKS